MKSKKHPKSKHTKRNKKHKHKKRNTRKRGGSRFGTDAYRSLEIVRNKGITSKEMPDNSVMRMVSSKKIFLDNRKRTHEELEHYSIEDIRMMYTRWKQLQASSRKQCRSKNKKEEEDCIDNLLDVNQIDEDLATSNFPISEQDRLEHASTTANYEWPDTDIMNNENDNYNDLDLFDLDTMLEEEYKK